jgi:3-dehydroquinate synthase
MKIKSSIRNYNVDFVNEEKISHKFCDFFIIDAKVYDLHPDKFENINEEKIIFVDALEENKEYIACADVIKKLIEAGIKRGNIICCIGGGIIQDIGGFVSSVLYRGIDWIYYPTTLLAQSDSCIGGKTSINFGDYKNTVGNFNPPNVIVIDTTFLKTLSSEDLMSGMGEIIKVYFLDPSKRYNFDSIFDEITSIKKGKLISEATIKSALSVKKEIIEIDEFDKGLRNIMNYGHTFGHALESITSFKIPHGIAVLYGIFIANHISYQLKYLNKKDYNNFLNVINVFRENTDFCESIIQDDFEIKKYLNYLKRDKKNTKDNEITCILTQSRGKMFKKSINLLNLEILVINAMQEMLKGIK